MSLCLNLLRLHVDAFRGGILSDESSLSWSSLFFEQFGESRLLLLECRVGLYESHLNQRVDEFFGVFLLSGLGQQGGFSSLWKCGAIKHTS